MKNTVSKNYLFLLLLFIFLFNSRIVNAQEEINIELTNVEFIGNDYFDTSTLEEIIISKESSNWFSQFLYSFSNFGSPPTNFDSLNIQDDLSILSSFYKAYGFFKPQISAEFDIESNGENNASLAFVINENTPSFIRDYDLIGLRDLPNKLYYNLLELVIIDSTNQFSEQLVEQNSAIVINYLQDQGYMLVGASTPIVEIDTVKNVVDISVEYNLGNRYRISNVKVEKSGPGKDLVSEQLIDEIANISADSYYSYNDLKLAQVRLYRTNLFSSAVIAGSVSDTVGNFVPVNIITKVGLLNELSPEIIGINEENTFKFGLGLSYVNKNFLGDARKLTIGASTVAQNISEFIQEPNLVRDSLSGYTDARISIEQPFLFGSPINTLLETYYTLEKKKNQWNATIYGAKLNLNFELPPYIFLTALSTYFTWQNSKYKFEKDYLKLKLNNISVTDIDKLSAQTTNTTSAILGVQLIKNNTDDLLFPTEGYSVSLLLEDGNSLPYLFSKIGNYNFGQAAYSKWVLNSTFYFPYMENIFDAFGMKFKIGNIQAYHGNVNDIPYNQRLTAGGSNSVRGWGSNDLPVEDNIQLPQYYTQNDIENVFRNISPGGFFQIEGSIEGREYLSDKIGVALFFDYGNVWNSYKDVRYDEFAVAAGFGFRYYSDFAPIRLDFGFKAYDPYDKRSFFTRLQDSPFLKTFKFQIGIGEAF